MAAVNKLAIISERFSFGSNQPRGGQYVHLVQTARIAAKTLIVATTTGVYFIR
jgi:hypothetical protein